MSLVRVKRSAQITLPAEARTTLRIKEGDYLEAEVVENGLLLRPVAVVDRTKAQERLSAVLERRKQWKWTGPGPEPTDDEVMEEVVEAIHTMRREHDQGGAR